MNKKSLLILLVCAVLACIAAWLAQKSASPATSTDTRAPGQKLLDGIDPSRIASVVFETPDGSVTLKRDAKDVWTVQERDGFTADASRLSGLIKGLLDLKIIQVQEAGPSQYPRLQLSPPTDTNPAVAKEQKGSVIRMLDAQGAAVTEIIVGKAPQSEGQDPMAAMSGGGVSGKFVRLGNDPSRVFLVNNAGVVSSDPAEWVVKTFFQPGPLSRVAVSGPAGFKGWEATREKPDSTFVLKDLPAGKQLAANTSSALATLLGYAQASDVLTKAQKEKLDRKDSRTAELTTFDGMTYKLTLTPLPVDAATPPPPAGPDGAPPSTGNYAVEAQVAGTYVEAPPAAGAKKPEEMTEEEKKADAEAKAAARKTWEEKLAAQQALAAHTFKVAAYTVEALWKTGTEVVEDIPPPPAAPGATPPELLTPPPGAPPAGNPSAPPPAGKAQAVTEPISVTTPPIEVPAAPPDAPKPVEEKPAAKDK